MNTLMHTLTIYMYTYMYTVHVHVYMYTVHVHVMKSIVQMCFLVFIIHVQFMYMCRTNNKYKHTYLSKLEGADGATP